MPIQAIRTQRLYRQIADQLRQLIERGEFPPGTLLPPERELAQALGVSRASVREALIALEVVGQVEVRVGHGVVVLEPKSSSVLPVMSQAARQQPWALDPEFSDETALDFEEEIPPYALLQARRHVEPEAAALAAEHVTPEALESIREAFTRNVEDNHRVQKRGGGGRPHSHAGDRLFHMRIAEASGNPAYALLIKHLLGHQYGVMFRRLQDLYMTTDMSDRSQEDHQRILDALIAKDANAARAAMADHLDYVLETFFAEAE
ncbi:FadR/GntR family transcriptional regulator [Phytohalomonas tamaricis]|uniref:FadR/GntR family transcriptional regulator n=1 Tax=Phytohalomonas tamaricis TaxID=2081032 RepID=UPI000D0B7540|nr:FCD domain-containing protein [Phytohalomonas tamaricis]